MKQIKKWIIAISLLAGIFIVISFAFFILSPQTPQEKLIPHTVCVLERENNSFFVYEKDGKPYPLLCFISPKDIPMKDEDGNTVTIDQITPKQMITIYAEDLPIKTIYPTSYDQMDHIVVHNQFDQAIFEEGWEDLNHLKSSYQEIESNES